MDILAIFRSAIDQPGRAAFIASYITIGLVMYWLLSRQVITRGHWFGALLLTPVGIFAIMVSAWWVQGGQPHLTLEYAIRHGSHAAVFGDVVLTIGLSFRAYHQRKIHNLHRFWKSKRWFTLAYLPGIVAGWIFHTLGGPADSQSPVLAERMHDSATSWAHNFGVMPGIVATVVYTTVPLWCTSGARKYAASIMIAVLIWVGLSLWDALWRITAGPEWGMNPHWLDAPNGMNWNNWWERFGDLWQVVTALF